MFLPKPVARKLGLKPMPDPDEERVEKTLVHACMQLISEYQGKGLGTMLMQGLIEWAKDNGWERIEANHVPAGTDNEHWRWGWAVPKWERMGFRIARTRPSTSVVLNLGSSGCVPPCEIAKCCKDKGFFTCAECPDMESCERIAEKGMQTSLVDIRKMGVKSWAKKQFDDAMETRRKAMLDAVNRAFG